MISISNCIYICPPFCELEIIDQIDATFFVYSTAQSIRIPFNLILLPFNLYWLLKIKCNDVQVERILNETSQHHQKNAKNKS